MKIVTIVGARPQFVKAAVVSRAISEYNKNLEVRSEKLGNKTFQSEQQSPRTTNHESLTTNHEPASTINQQLLTEKIIHTGQHFDKNMSDIFFEEMRIPKPDYNLNINGLTHGAMTGQMIEKIETVLIKEIPDWVLVYGDTNSTIAGALAARKLNIRIAHVEAGLRSFNTRMPEETNRIVTDRICDILFCPTDTAVNNLHKEGYPNKLSGNSRQSVINVGDVMYDAALFYKQFACKPDLGNLPKSDFILATMHRQENTDDQARLNGIIESFLELSHETPVILPLHPRTRKIIKTSNKQIDCPNLYIIDPVSYFEMLWLLTNCKLVMTDSGGLQKEAYYFKKPCITLRDETEWVELIEKGVNVLAGASKTRIISAFAVMNRSNLDFSGELYGDGNAGNKIVENLVYNKG